MAALSACIKGILIANLYSLALKTNMLNGNDQIYKSERREIKIFEISAPTKYTFALYIIRKTYYSNSAPVEHSTHYTTIFP